MVTPIEEPQEEVIQEEVEIITTSSKSKDKPKFDFAVEDTDRLDLTVYTVSTKPAEENWRTLEILAPSYDSALEMAGINKDNTVKISSVAFEG
tara:strand:- start:94 stop:372 length:279 start_codon:yes stop_codon:yes gene_type:complete